MNLTNLERILLAAGESELTLKEISARSGIKLQYLRDTFSKNLHKVKTYFTSKRKEGGGKERLYTLNLDGRNLLAEIREKHPHPVLLPAPKPIEPQPTPTASTPTPPQIITRQQAPIPARHLSTIPDEDKKAFMIFIIIALIIIFLLHRAGIV